MDRRVRTVLTILDHEYHASPLRGSRCRRRRWSVSPEHLFKHHIRTSIRDYVRRRGLRKGPIGSPQRRSGYPKWRAR